MKKEKSVFVKPNKCCYFASVIVNPGWSGLCRCCGRYHYDEVHRQLSVIESKKTLGLNNWYALMKIKPIGAEKIPKLDRERLPYCGH